MQEINNGESYLDVSFEKLEQLESDYQDIEFEDCRFLDSDFSGSQFKNCKFINCEFSRCNLSLVKLLHSRLFGVHFIDSKLVGIDWTRANWPVYHADFELKFERCIMNDASFFGLTLNELQFDECKLHDVDFREGNFQNSTMIYCDFTHSLFTRTNLRSVDFSDSSHYAINVLENDVQGAKFSRYEALSLLECLGVELVD